MAGRESGRLGESGRSGSTPSGSYAGFGGQVERTLAASEPEYVRGRRAPHGSPNIVLMMVDNMGYSDLGCYGSEIQTPHLDRLADEGLRMTNFHTTPICSPTRAALMTGLNAHVAGVGRVIESEGMGFPGYNGELADYAVTAGEVFRSNGYATMLVGKWHLTTATGDDRPKDGWPLQRGFDRFYGFMGGQTHYHAPHHLVEDNHYLDVDEFPPGYYFTDDLTDKAIEMIRSAKSSNPERPFFMYFAHGAVHAPLQAKAEDIERYRHVYDEGWDICRERRFDRQKQLGVIPPHAVLPPRNSEPALYAVKPWDELNGREKTLFARYMACYAAMVDNIDQNFGRLRTALEELGEWDNTIVVFLSDNGAACSGQVTGSSNHVRGAISRTSGTDVQATDVFEMDYALLDQMGGPRTFPDYPAGWGMASNTPFRMYMTWTYAGGHQVPFIVSGPASGAIAGSVRGQYAYVTDVLPTLVEMTAVEMPSERHGVPLRPLDGVSFSRMLRDEDVPSEHEEQYYEVWGQRAFYRDGWSATALHFSRTSFRDDHWELHDLAEDPTQSTDLGEKDPERLEELIEAFDEAAWENQVYPLDERIGLGSLGDPTDVPPQRWVMRPGMPRIYSANRMIAQRSFHIDVDVHYQPGDQGVLVAHGSQSGGYVLYIEDGKLCLSYNYYGEPYSLATAAPLPGDRIVTLDAAAPGGTTWDMRLLIDGNEAAVAAGWPMLAVVRGSAGMGIDVGLNRISPVDWALGERHGVFRYTGNLRTVTFVAGEPAPDQGPELGERLRRLGMSLQ
jgi:arylsulfatase